MYICNISRALMLSLFWPCIFFTSGRGAGEHHRAGLPGQAVPDRRCSGEDHEDEEDPEPQPAGIRTLQPAQVPCEGTALFTSLQGGQCGVRVYLIHRYSDPWLKNSQIQVHPVYFDYFEISPRARVYLWQLIGDDLERYTSERCISEKRTSHKILDEP